MNFEQFMEEWKPFPKDKVNRQIDKKSKSEEPQDKSDVMTMRAVRNYKTRSTDYKKRDQAFIGKDRHKTNRQLDKHDSEQEKRYKKADKQEKKGNIKKAQKQADKGNEAGSKANAIRAVARSYNRTSREDEEKQDKINKKSKEDRAKAKRMFNKGKLEVAFKKPAVKGHGKGGFKNESLDYTDYLASIRHPLYEKEGVDPKCPPGYIFDKQLLMCVPKSNKDAVGNNQKGDKDLKPGNGAGYNVFGNSGYDGGFAFEEPPTGSGTEGAY